MICLTMTNTAPENIYLDYAAATPIDHAVLDAMLPYLTDRFYNPSAPYARRPCRARTDVRGRPARPSRALHRGAPRVRDASPPGATESEQPRVCLAWTARRPCRDAGHRSTRAALSCARGRAVHVLVGVGARRDAWTPAAGRPLRSRPDAELVSVALANGEVGTASRTGPRRWHAVVAAERASGGSRRGRIAPVVAARRRLPGGGRAFRWGSPPLGRRPRDACRRPRSTAPSRWACCGRARACKPVDRSSAAAGRKAGLRSGTENVAGVIGFAARARDCRASARRQEARRLRELRDRLQRAACCGRSLGASWRPQEDRWRLPGRLNMLRFPAWRRAASVILLDQRGVSVGDGLAHARRAR